MAALVCAMSGEMPQEPVVSAKSGHLFEKKTVTKYILETNTCPVTGDDLSTADLIDLKPNSAVKPKAPAASSLGGLMGLMQTEWDSSVVETHALRKEVEQLRSELAHTLYQHDAACRVIAKLIKERDDAVAAMNDPARRAAVAPAAAPAGAAGGAMDVEPTGITDQIKDRITEVSQTLSKGRKKRPISPNLATEDAIKGYAVKASHATHGKSEISCVDAHQKNGNLLLTGGGDKNVVLSDTGTGKPMAVMKGHTGKVLKVMFHPTQDVVFSSSTDKTVKVWKGGAMTQNITVHSADVTGISLHCTGDYFVSASADKTWAFHDLTTGQCKQVVSDASVTAGYSTACFHPDGLILGTGTMDNMLRVWDVKSQANVVKFQCHSGPVASLAFSENGYYLSTASTDGIKIWDLRKVAKQGADAQAVKHFEIPQAKSVAFDYSGTYFGVGAGGIVKVWHTKSWNEVVQIQAHEKPIQDIAFGVDASFVTSCSLDSTAKILTA